MPHAQLGGKLRVKEWSILDVKNHVSMEIGTLWLKYINVSELNPSEKAGSSAGECFHHHRDSDQRIKRRL